MKITKEQLKQLIKEELEEALGEPGSLSFAGGAGRPLQRLGQAVKGATKPTYAAQADPKNRQTAAKNISDEIARYLKIESDGFLLDVLISAIEEAAKKSNKKLNKGSSMANFGIGGVLRTLQTLKQKQEQAG
jgi:hypothetical protein